MNEILLSGFCVVNHTVVAAWVDDDIFICVPNVVLHISLQAEDVLVGEDRLLLLCVAHDATYLSLHLLATPPVTLTGPFAAVFTQQLFASVLFSGATDIPNKA